ncbi:hypothetical protein ACLOJK_023237, partial [Asimina triloba]
MGRVVVGGRRCRRSEMEGDAGGWQSTIARSGASEWRNGWLRSSDPGTRRQRQRSKRLRKNRQLDGLKKKLLGASPAAARAAALVGDGGAPYSVLHG